MFLTDLYAFLHGSDTLIAILLGTFPLRAPVPHHRERTAHGGTEGGDSRDLVLGHSRPVESEDHQAHRDHGQCQALQRDVHFSSHYGSLTLTNAIFAACERLRERRITSPPLLLLEVDVFPSMAFQELEFPDSKIPMWS